MKNRERSQVWIFTIMVVVLILLLFCPVVFGQVSHSVIPGLGVGMVGSLGGVGPALASEVVGTVFYCDGKTPLVLNDTATDSQIYLFNSTTNNLVAKTTTDNSGYFVFAGTSGYSYYIRADYNNGIVATTPTFKDLGDGIPENVVTSRASTDLITIDSLS